MGLRPGFYCGTSEGICLVKYIDVPDTRIFKPADFVERLQSLPPGKKIYAEFNNRDGRTWATIPKNIPIDFGPSRKSQNYRFSSF